MPLAEHDRAVFPCACRYCVSIHVPLAEHDEDDVRGGVVKYLVSIHVPLAEHDPAEMLSWQLHKVSIHVPLAEHDPSGTTDSQFLQVSIHVPLAEHDACTGACRIWSRRFQFTCPSRSTT